VRWSTGPAENRLGTIDGTTFGGWTGTQQPPTASRLLRVGPARQRPINGLSNVKAAEILRRARAQCPLTIAKGP